MTETLPKPGLRHRRLLVAFVILGGTVLLGIYAARFFDRADPTYLAVPAGKELILTDLTLGTPLNATEAKKTKPKLRQELAYTTLDKLALRTTTHASITAPYSVSVRLLTSSGDVLELSPSSISLQPGTDTFCCWTVSEPGQYTMQIFRPEKVITSLPLTIKEDISTQPRL